MKQIKILLDENKRLLGYCDFGDMPNAIEIEVEDDFKFKPDIRNYLYEEDKLQYKPSLEELKERKRSELKKIRESKISENLEVNGSIFQVREKDLENFEDVSRAVRRKKKTETDTRNWILADNSIREFTYGQLLDVSDERALRKERIFEEYAKIAIALEKATTAEEIEKITWNEGI